MILNRKPFHLGRTLAAPGALKALEESGENPSDFLDRHARGDWGTVDADDWKANEDAMENGSRLVSAYALKSGAKIWVITEARGDDGERAATTLLLPGEY